ncbi:HMG box-containing protein 4-like isoform X1 [Hippoglossus hippoglossus]|uniref:HMG box-containing protein 4-like isoform X1 n=1 Tax=Hippoglossus hippoglossus TaxID=8267 RepID=UPI00148C1128|nr:HMG box-containing protein 4-like isoform X1 [Hippoglossus hippoglossus]XP_034448178.1 HMG box-containing protein 4-like isoform X1 [Hippoglossus hippoglossus]
MEEPKPDVEEHDIKEPKGSVSKMTQQSGVSGTEPDNYGADFLSAVPVCEPHDRWRERGGGGGRGGEASPSSLLEYSVYLCDQHRTLTPPVTPPTQRPCPFTPPLSSVTNVAAAVNAAEDPAVPGPMTGTCSPICSMCSPTASGWDSLRSTSRIPSCSDGDPVSAAAHLHLLGESLSLIGHHLQETDKMLNVSSSLSLLLDSLLCALAPIICLTAQIPELRSCTQHTLASTLENIAYMMPGL